MQMFEIKTAVQFLFNPNTVELSHATLRDYMKSLTTNFSDFHAITEISQGLHETPTYDSNFIKSLKRSGISRNPWFHTLTVTYIYLTCTALTYSVATIVYFMAKNVSQTRILCYCCFVFIIFSN